MCLLLSAARNHNSALPCPARACRNGNVTGHTYHAAAEEEVVEGSDSDGGVGADVAAEDVQARAEARLEAADVRARAAVAAAEEAETMEEIETVPVSELERRAAEAPKPGEEPEYTPVYGPLPPGVKATTRAARAERSRRGRQRIAAAAAAKGGGARLSEGGGEAEAAASPTKAKAKAGAAAGGSRSAEKKRTRSSAGSGSASSGARKKRKYSGVGATFATAAVNLQRVQEQQRAGSSSASSRKKKLPRRPAPPPSLPSMPPTFDRPGQENGQNLVGLKFASAAVNLQRVQEEQREKVKKKSPKVWDVRFRELVEWKETHGNFLVEPASSPLAKWLIVQRVHYHDAQRKGQGFTSAKMTQERVDRLNSIGFPWRRFPSWDDRLQELRSFREEYGHCEPPPNCSPRHAALRSWVGTQRMDYKKLRDGKRSAMTEDRIRRLADVGFKFRIMEDRNELWDRHFEALKEYRAEHGHCKVPVRHGKLGRWVQIQRVNFKLHFAGKSSPLTKERVDALNAIGFTWDNSIAFHKQKDRLP